MNLDEINGHANVARPGNRGSAAPAATVGSNIESSTKPFMPMKRTRLQGRHCWDWARQTLKSSLLNARDLSFTFKTKQVTGYYGTSSIGRNVWLYLFVYGIVVEDRKRFFSWVWNGQRSDIFHDFLWFIDNGLATTTTISRSRALFPSVWAVTRTYNNQFVRNDKKLPRRWTRPMRTSRVWSIFWHLSPKNIENKMRWNPVWIIGLKKGYQISPRCTDSL